MNKKILVLIAIIIMIIITIALNLSSKEKKIKEINPTILVLDNSNSIEESNNSYKKNKFQKNVTPKIQADIKIDINKMLPCEALKLLSKDKTPWSYLKPNNYSRYNDMLESLSDIENFDQLPEKKKKKLTQQINQYTDIGSIPLIYDLYDKIHNSKASKEVKTFFSNYLSSSLLGGLTNHNDALYLVKYLISIKDYKQAEEKFEEIANSKSTTSDIINGERANIYRSAKTPSEMAAAIETISRVPTYDLSFLISLQKSKSLKITQSSLDKIAEKLINETLNYKEPLDINYLSYAVALKIHSRGKFLKRKYGTQDQLVKRVILENSSDNSSTCDDRILIDLCEKHCSR